MTATLSRRSTLTTTQSSGVGVCLSLPQIKQLVNEVTAKAKPAKAAAAAADSEVDGNGNEKKTEPEPKDAVDVDVESAARPSSSLRSGLLQLRPLFVKPYLRLSLWVYLLNFCVLLG